MKKSSAASIHSIRHRRAPTRWEEGFPLGNGRLGVMFWGDGNPLRLTLDHADLWDLRCNKAFLESPDYTYANLRRLIAAGKYEEALEIFETRERRDNPVGPTKISIGRAELDIGTAMEYDCSLSLDRAMVTGTIKTAHGSHDVELWVDREGDLICLRVTGLPPAAELKLLPLASLNPDLAKLGHPAPAIEADGNLRQMIYVVPEGPVYAVVWNAAGPVFFMAVHLDKSPDAALAGAKARWNEAMKTGFDQLRARHVQAWQSFWSQSAVYLPEAEMELLWYFGLYLLAGMSRRDAAPPGLQGVWAMDGVMPPWRGDYHADMNVQETFWPAGPTGHIELMDNWCAMMKTDLPLAQTFTRRFFGTEGAFWRAQFLPRYTMVGGWFTVSFAWSNTGWLVWLIWLRWRYSMDLQWLAEIGYPVVAEAFKFYRANLENGQDGCLHVPLSTSPEYRDNTCRAWSKDPNIDIALIRRVCDWLCEMESALGRSDLTESARQVHARLTPYALAHSEWLAEQFLPADNILCLWPEKLLEESHRHPSHLMAIHPAMDLTIEGDEKTQAIITNSLNHFLSLGQHRWAGHTYAQWVSLAACAGKAGWAYEALRQFLTNWMLPNGLHVNSGAGMTAFTSPPGALAPFTAEASCGVTTGICDMLLQGWGDRVRVFPAVPAQWTNIVFRDLCAEGAFRVSAIRLNGRTQWVQIKAGVERTIRLRDPFNGTPCVIKGTKLQREGQDFVGKLKAGKTVTLKLEGQNITLTKAIRQTRAAKSTPFGLR